MPSPTAPEPNPGAAFDVLVRAHYGRLCNFAYRFVGSRDVAEDIVQDVFTRIWQRHETFDLRDPLPYLYQAVRNRAVTHRRQRVVRDRFHERAVLHEEEAATPDVEVADLADAVAEAIGSLPERCRVVFLMSREQDLTYAEIARALDISVKTVETQIGRALKTLRVRLAGYLSVAIAAGISTRWLS